MEEENKNTSRFENLKAVLKKYKLKYLFALIFAVLFLTFMSFTIMYHTNKQKQNLQLNKIYSTSISVDKDISHANYKPFYFSAYVIHLTNDSHKFFEYVIAKNTTEGNTLTSTYKDTQKNENDHLIDTNVGKVKLYISFVTKEWRDGKLSRNSYSKTFTCYTKEVDNTLRFYTKSNCKTEYDFMINSDYYSDTSPIHVNVTIQTAYNINKG